MPASEKKPRQAEIALNLHYKQGLALETRATEVLYGGSAGSGKSHLVRTAGITWCSSIPGLQFYLFRRLRDDLVKNHIEGPQGLRAMLVPWTTSRLVTIVEDEIRFWNGSKIYLCHCKDEKDRFKYLGSEIHVLCCERNELAVMGDRSLRRIRDLRVGDYVMTLRGPRKVTWVGEERLRPCVRATVRDDNGKTFEQIHSTTHCVLTPGGWLSNDHFSKDRLGRRGGEPTEFHSSYKFSSLLQRMCRNKPPLHGMTRWDWLRSRALHRSIPGRSTNGLPRGSSLVRRAFDMLSALRSTQSRSPHKFFELWSKLHRTVWPFLDIPSVDQPHIVAPKPAVECHQADSEGASYMALPVLENDFGSSACDIREEPPPSSGCEFALVLYGPSRNPVEASAALSSQPDESRYVRSGYRASNSRCDYLPSRDYHGGYQSLATDRAHDDARRQDDAVRRSPTCSPSGDLDTVPSHNLCRSQYFHPYTGELRTATEPVHLGTCFMEPCGERWTIDITVEDENHYITEGGFVNRNCIDELTTFTPTIYRFLRSRVRMAGVNIPSQFAGMFPRILSASNPGGIGHSFVKAMFIDARAPMEIEEVDSSEGGMLRQFIPARLSDNPSIDPDSYVGKLEGLGSPALVKAMRDGDWNVVAGAFFPEFSTDQHVIAPVSLPVYWQRFRSFDWGSARPFCVLWYAVSDGELAEFPRGALIVYREWYGAPKDSLGLSIPNVGLRLTAEEVADGIAEREKGDLHAGRVMTGVADPSIFHENGGPSIADRMSARKVFWRPADNARVARNGAMGGWDQVRARLKGDGERPGLYLFSTCRDLIRTLPSVQHDEGRPEDLDTSGDDHGVDSLRYGVTSRPYVAPLPPDSDPHEPDRYARRWKPARRVRGTAMSA